MRRIDRYLLMEAFVPAMVGGTLVLMLLVGDKLYRLLRLLYTGAPARDIGIILLYSLPAVIMLALPASLMLGTALGLNRLERDRELMSLRMAGVPLKRLALPFLVLGVLSSIALFVLQEKVTPFTAHQAVRLTNKLAYDSPTAVVPRDVVFKVGEKFLYVREVDPRTHTLYGVVACLMNPDGGPSWLTIPVAENHDGTWVLRPDPMTKEKPKLYAFNRKGDLLYYGEGSDERMSGLFNLKQDAVDFLSDQPLTADELTLHELRALAHGVRSSQLGYGLVLSPYELTFQIHRKFAAPLAALVAVLIAIPLAVRFGRSGGYVGLLLSVIVAFFFVISQQWAQVLAESARLHPVIAAWGPNALFGVLGLVLLVIEE